MKKTISFLLAIVMVFSLLPLTAFAADGANIYFDTTFEDGMEAGDTFTVTGYLENNPGMNTMTVSLKWNDKVVKFNGFATEYDEESEEELLVTDVFKAVWTPEVNYNEGIIVAYRAKNTSKEGTLFVANFEIIAGGDLGIGLKTENATEFEMANADGEDINPTIDYSAISGLKAAGEGAGPDMPEDAPFTAITTDAGPIVAIEEMDWVDFNYSSVPYYVVTIPADATTAYVTAPDQVVMEDWNTMEMMATGYAADLSDPYASPLYVSYYYEETDDGPKVEVPMYMTAMDSMGGAGEVELCFVAPDEYNDATHAFGIEDAGYACLGLISFKYDDGSANAPSYEITPYTAEGGSVVALDEDYEEITTAKEGTLIYLDVVAEDGYTAKRWGYTFEGTSYDCENGVFTMPAGDVELFAEFQKKHTHDYNKDVVADKYLKDAATCKSGAVYYKSCECGEFITTADTFVSGDPVTHHYVGGKCEWCELTEVVGYHFATSADVSAENGGTATVHVKITGHSNPAITSYNAYDLTLTYDNTKLEFVSGEGADKGDQIKIEKKGENQIQIVGVGDAKGFDVEVATLTFKTIAEGAANVTIDKVQVSDKDEAVTEDIPEATPKHDEEDTGADETPDVSVIVVPYTVTKPDFISGADKVLDGENYTFSYTDTTNYTYSDLIVKVGGEEVTPVEENGVYTIYGVTGAIEITATQTANSYDVTKPENVTGPDKATYGTNYVFTVTPSKEDMAIDTVTVKYADGSEVPYTINENGEYVIDGTSITGAFTITVTEKEKMTTVTFTGIEEDEIEGGNLTMTAEIGKDFTFKLIKEEGYDYTVKIGETELTESEETAGQYTIPAEKVIKGGIQVDITKADNTRPVVDVAEYINLDGKTMFLVTAKWKDKVLAYGEDTMFWSSKYTVTGETEAGAYCWLVVSTDEMNTVELVKAAAEAAIVEAAEGATATAVKYNYDINGTTKVDVNDAQLAYDMYNASYMEFTENLPMLKFLEADMETDAKLDTKDVAAIISYIVSGENA